MVAITNPELGDKDDKAVKKKIQKLYFLFDRSLCGE